MLLESYSDTNAWLEPDTHVRLVFLQLVEHVGLPVDVPC